MGDRAIPHRGTGAGERSRIGPPKVEGLSLWGIELFPIEVRAQVKTAESGRPRRRAYLYGG